jgi:hypothetical protein
MERLCSIVSCARRLRALHHPAHQIGYVGRMNPIAETTFKPIAIQQRHETPLARRVLPAESRSFKLASAPSSHISQNLCMTK